MATKEKCLVYLMPKDGLKMQVSEHVIQALDMKTLAGPFNNPRVLEIPVPFDENIVARFLHFAQVLVQFESEEDNADEFFIFVNSAISFLGAKLRATFKSNVGGICQIVNCADFLGHQRLFQAGIRTLADIALHHHELQIVLPTPLQPVFTDFCGVARLRRFLIELPQRCWIIFERNVIDPKHPIVHAWKFFQAKKTDDVNLFFNHLRNDCQDDDIDSDGNGCAVCCCPHTTISGEEAVKQFIVNTVSQVEHRLFRKDEQVCAVVLSGAFMTVDFKLSFTPSEDNMEWDNEDDHVEELDLDDCIDSLLPAIKLFMA